MKFALQEPRAGKKVVLSNCYPHQKAAKPNKTIENLALFSKSINFCFTVPELKAAVLLHELQRILITKLLTIAVAFLGVQSCIHFRLVIPLFLAC